MCIAICDPLQRRVHKLIPQSGEVMMMDNSNVDNSDTKIVHLMCLSSAGGLPLATLVTTRKDKVLSYLSPYCQHMHSMDGVHIADPLLGGVLLCHCFERCRYFPTFSGKLP